MKLHLPLSLRAALLAVCALVSSVAYAENMTSDFEFTGSSSNTVHRGATEISFDGNGRYSYTASPTGDGVVWMQAGEAKVTMTNMKNVVLRNLNGVIGQRKSSYLNYYYVASTDIDISNSESFLFSNNASSEQTVTITYFDRFFNQTFSHSDKHPSASLSAGGTVNLQNIKEIEFTGNKGALMRGGWLTIDGSERVVFSNHTDCLFEENRGTELSYVMGSGVFPSISGGTTTASFKNIKELIFKDNESTLCGKAGGKISFADCESITFDNTVGIGASAQFENCANVVFINTSLSSSTFTGSDTIEIKDSQGGAVGVNPVFENIGKGLYITNNGSLFSTGFTAAGSEDGQAELVISGNKDSAGTWSAASFNKVEVKENESTADIALISSATDIGSLSIEDNRLVSDSELKDVIKISSARNVDAIRISRNIVEAPSNKFETGIITVYDAEDIGSLEISGNIIGCKREKDAWVVVDAEKSFDDVFGRSKVTGRTKGGLSSTVVIKDNIVGGIGISHKNSFTMSDLLSLDVVNNEVIAPTRFESVFVQQAWFADLKLSNITRVNFDRNKANIRISSLDLQGAEEFTFTNSETMVLGFHHYTASDDPHTISAKKVTITGNYGYDKGGAFYESVTSTEILVFEGCGTVTIQGNKINGESLEKAAGAFIYSLDEKAPLVFRDNDKVLIRGNYITDGKSAQLNAIHITSGLDLRAQAGQTIELYDGMHIGGVLSINETAEGEDARTGSVTISGAHAAEDLKKLGFTPTAEDLAASRTVEAGAVHVHGGSLTLEEMTLAGTNGITTEAAASVSAKNVTLRSTKEGMALTNVSFKGKNSIAAPAVTASGGAWSFNPGAANSSTAVVHIDFLSAGNTLTTQEQEFRVVYDGTLAPGKYKLMDFNSDMGSWVGSDSVTLKGVEAKGIDLPGYGDVYYTIKGDTYTLWFDYSGSMYQGEMPEQRPSTALLWSGADGTWKEGAGADVWTGVVKDRNFYKGDLAVFRSAATVTIEGEVQPEDVLVSLDKGKVTFNSKNGGKIAGAASITKLGEGELALNLANSYTGYEYGGRTVGTILKEGKLTVGNANALGKSAALIHGGTLDLSGLAVRNDIVIAATSATLNGASLYAGKLTLESGDVVGEQDAVLHLAQDAELISGSLSHNISGSGALVKTGAGTVTLSGKKVEPAGGITVDGGTLVLSGSTVTADSAVNKGMLSLTKAVYTGDIAVENGATLRVRESIVSGNFTIKSGGAADVDGLQLMANDSLKLIGGMSGRVSISGGKMEVVGQRVLNGSLTLDGGELTISAGGSLQVNGALNTTASTVLYANVHQLQNGKNPLIYMLSKDKLNLEDIYMPEIKGSRAVLTADNTYINELNNTWYWGLCLIMDSRTLTWIKDVTNEWGLQLDGKRWQTTSDDKRFFNLDYVIFENAGEVNIVSAVNPGRITVKGEENTTFSGEGSITGKASLIKDGGCTLEIATDNKDYSGAVRVNEGTLLVSHDNALGSAEVNVGIGASYKVSDGCRVSEARVIFNGASTIHDVKGGTAAVVFADASTVAGSYTLAEQNTLTIGTAGAAFTGSFTFAGGTLKLQNNAAGAAVGIFTLDDGKVSFTSGSVTTIDISDCLGLVAGEQYTLISLAAVDNMETYFQLDGLLDGTEGEIRYDENTHALVLTLTEVQNDPAGEGTDRPGGTLPGDDEEEEDPTLPGTGEEEDITPTPEEPVKTLPAPDKNRNATLQALEAAMSKGELTGELANLAAEAVTLAAEDPAAAAELLDKLSGAELATAMTSQIVGNLTHLRRLRANMGSGLSVDATGKNAVYLMGFDEQHSVDESEDGRGMKRTEWGGTLGYERTVGQKSLLGLALTSGSADVTPTRGEGYSEDALRVDLYFVANFGSSWQSVTSLGYGTHSFDTTRHLPGHTAKAGMDGTSINFQQEFSYTIHTSANNSWQPFLSVELSSNSMDAFTESGAGTASLVGESQSAMAVDITLGTRFIHRFDMSGTRGSVQLQAGVVVSAGDTAGELDLHFSGAPEQGFTVGAAGYDGVGFNLGGGVELPISKSAAVTGSANAILRSGATEYGASVGLRFHF